jgi:intein/homing endonuclease
MSLFQPDTDDHDQDVVAHAGLPELEIGAVTSQALLSAWQGDPAILVTSPPGAGKCLVGETRVHDPKTGALARMDDLVARVEAGETATVTALDERMRLVPAPVTAAVRNGPKPVFEVTLRSGRRITGTKTHPLRGEHGWVEIGDLRKGNLVAVARELQGGQSPSALGHHEISLLGLLVGDGYLARYTPELCTGDLHGEIANTCRDDARALGLRTTDGDRRIYITDPRFRSRHVHSRIGALLDKVQLRGVTASGKFIPEDVFELPDDGLALFLNRLWGTDGCISTRSDGSRAEASYSTISHRLALDVQLALLRFGIASRVRKVRREAYDHRSDRQAYEVVVGGLRSLRVFLLRVGALGKGEDAERAWQVCRERTENTNVDLLPLSAWELVDRNNTGRGFFASLNRALGNHPGNDFHRWKRRLSRARGFAIAEALDDDELRDLAQSDVWWDEVVSVTPAGVAETYDIEVEGLHNFVADGIVAHNSRLIVTVASHLSVRGDMRVAVACQTTVQALDLANRFAQAAPATRVTLLGPSKSLRPDRLDSAVFHQNTAGKISQEAGVVIATTAKFQWINPEAYFADILLVDEAYQSTWADFAACAPVARQVLMVGDPGQIPPVVTGDVSRYRPMRVPPHMPAPDALEMTQGDNVLRYQLPDTWRCGPQTAKVLQPLYPFAFGSRRPDQALHVGGQAAPEMAVERVEGYGGADDPALADAVAARVRHHVANGTLVEPDGTRREVLPGDVAVVVAHNAQVAAVRARLSDLVARGTVIATTERLQGAEFDVVVAWSPLAGKRSLSDFDLQPGRLCVMLSRHTKHLTVVERHDTRDVLEAHRDLDDTGSVATICEVLGLLDAVASHPASV